MDKEQLANAITKAIGYAENGGKPIEAKAGKTGEMKSIFQYTPDTWKLYSKQILGKDDVPLDNDSETYVTHQKVLKWIDEGYSPEQIASMWNAGEQRPDAYKQNWKGTNKKYGVNFDTPAYAKKVADYTNQFLNESKKTNTQNAQTNSQMPQNQVGNISGDNNPLSKMMDIVNMVKQRSAQGQTVNTGVGTSKAGDTGDKGLLGSLLSKR